ncbi:hypothetical protein [Microlunatus speluncae]|uniref:hypothetical protein n=1 Tax=Microlunatus speluncae TaxID=2594267 RepID=UPI0012663BC0|nr:hypothetical protein [Microlunatus speluncae]
MVIAIMVMADYGADPVWTAESGGRPGAMLSLTGLPVSDRIRAELRTWAAEYDALSGTDYEWPDEDRHRVWVEAGRTLADRLAQELGEEYRVHYFEDLQ